MVRLWLIPRVSTENIPAFVNQKCYIGSKMVCCFVATFTPDQYCFILIINPRIFAHLIEIFEALQEIFLPYKSKCKFWRRKNCIFFLALFILRENNMILINMEKLFSFSNIYKKLLSLVMNIAIFILWVHQKTFNVWCECQSHPVQNVVYQYEERKWPPLISRTLK